MKKIKIFIIIIFLLLLIPLIINSYVIFTTKNNIYNTKDLNTYYDIGMVLGCGIKNNRPSLMLQDRLDKAIELYNKGYIKKILITGDHHEDYSEVNVMETYLEENNIPKENILLDYKGYNTSASISNYEENYSANTVIVITQKYHMYRALYLLQKHNLKGIGVIAKEIRYKNQLSRDIREVLARCKDFIANFW